MWGMEYAEKAEDKCSIQFSGQKRVSALANSPSDVDILPLDQTNKTYFVELRKRANQRSAFCIIATRIPDSAHCTT
jgi:hypothetical protein